MKFTSLTGINPYSLMGANVGCYFTSGISEVENIKLRTNVERLSLIGGSKGMLSNRVSFALNLTGNFIDNHCSSNESKNERTY